MGNLNIYYLCHYISGVAQTHIDYVEGLLEHSEHNLRYLEIAKDSQFFDIEIPNLADFDVVLLHHNLNLYGARLPKGVISQLKSFKGLKIYFAQDEYTNPTQCAEQLKEIGIHVVFGCADENWRKFWPEGLLPDLQYRRFLPGYSPDSLKSVKSPPIGSRQVDIVYRGSHLGHFYGQLGYEKSEIGWRMKDYLEGRNFKIDIEWDRKHQIYGPRWLTFLQSGKTTLITESGSSLVHRDAEHMMRLHATKEVMLKAKTLEQYETTIADFKDDLSEDGDAVIATVSQKVFEAAASGTVMIGYVGNYSGILIPDIHYIPLEKNWSNIESVLSKISNIEYLQKMSERAYRDLILSGDYTYKKFAQEVDANILDIFRKLGFEKKVESMPKHYFERPTNPANSTEGTQGIKVSKLRWRYNQVMAILSDITMFFALLLPAVLANLVVKRSKSLRDSKVFIGINECTGNIGQLQNCLRGNVKEVHSKARGYPMYSQYRYSELLDAHYYHVPIVFESVRANKFSLKDFARSFYYKGKDLLSIFFCYDDLILNSGVPFLFLNLDYFLFALSGVRFSLFHTGDDVRQRAISNKIWAEVAQPIKISGLNPLPDANKNIYLLKRLWSQRISELCGDFVFTTFEQATFLSKPSFQFQIPVNFTEESFPLTNNTVVRICHAPSDRSVKRTDIVLEAIEFLKKEGICFEFELIENMRNDELTSKLSSFDIVIDQPNLLYGLLLREAMAAGCAVVGIPIFSGQEHLNKTPVIPFEADSTKLAETLKTLIETPEKLLEIRQKSHRFARENFTSESVYLYLEAVLEGKHKHSVFPLENQKSLCMSYCDTKLQRRLISMLMSKFSKSKVTSKDYFPHPSRSRPPV